MKAFFATLFTMTALALSAADAPKDSPCYELRIYYAAPGKLDELNARFRDHTCKLFEKHGITNIGYWMPQDNPDQKLIYLLSYPSRAARDKSWRSFMADPDWRKAFAASEKNGKLVPKLESRFLTLTDYSPAIKPSASATPRVFELREYVASPGNLGALDARFRDHTVKLFEKHGMNNIGYWHYQTGQTNVANADDSLFYIISHASKEAAAASFKKFGADPDWVAARAASEKKAGGSLTVKGGVKSTFLNATDYSPIR